MSLQVLKRKSNIYKNKISGKGHNGFSINGGYRNIGCVGKTNLAKSVTRTRFKGNYPVGYGGLNGNYVVSINNSGSCCSNDNNIIKSSIKNTSGLLYSVVKHPTSVYNVSCSSSCNEISFNDNTNYKYSQDLYISNKSKDYSRCVTSQTNSVINTCCNRTFIGHNNNKTSNYFKDLNSNKTYHDYYNYTHTQFC